MLEERAAEWKDEYIRQGILIGEARGREKADAMLEERAAEWKDEYIRQGVLIGAARGEARGLGLALRDFLELRFGPLPPSVTSRIVRFSDAEALRRLTLFAYQTDSLQAFIDHLRNSDETSFPHSGKPLGTQSR